MYGGCALFPALFSLGHALSMSFTLFKDFSICPRDCEYAHSKHFCLKGMEENLGQPFYVKPVVENSIVFFLSHKPIRVPVNLQRNACKFSRIYHY